MADSASIPSSFHPNVIFFFSPFLMFSLIFVWNRSVKEQGKLFFDGSVFAAVMQQFLEVCLITQNNNSRLARVHDFYV